MLFTSAAFAFAFLPLLWVGFFTIAHLRRSLAALWLFAGSLFFYGYWMPEFVSLLMASIIFNFWVGRCIGTAADRQRARLWLGFGIVTNLVLLAYFKYANLLVETTRTLLGVNWIIDPITLPIGISFFTFTQIAFLADAYQKGTREYKPVHYGLFVTYFPHLIAGPILHHAQMMPQFDSPATYRINPANVSLGLLMFALGLFKKVVLADGVAPYADVVFSAADGGRASGFGECWLAALAYTLQLYFDFSGYSDMAIGLSWLFNIRLPFNFDSPYRSANIIDFWRRWHMSLSAFLRDYLYVSLGGNRRGRLRRYVNLLTTMLLGGLWHGANWTFLVWGGLHGAYLVFNHLFRSILSDAVHQRLAASRSYRWACWFLTMLSVMAAWVVFRADTFAGAKLIYSGMLGLNAMASSDLELWNAGLRSQLGWLWCLVLTCFAVIGPNTNWIGEAIRVRVESRLSLRMVLCGASAAVAVLLILINAARGSSSPFIYFNF
ncbi:MAG: MBOAT family O-acyltransferase [Burkholderiaceae bacterium]